MARTRVLADVTNTGERAGSEVVQMYIRDLISSVTRPIKELKAFRKIYAASRARRETVEFEITPDLLAFYDIDMKFVVEPGDFEIMVGNSSRDADLAESHPLGGVRCKCQINHRSSHSSRRPATAWATPPPTSSS